MPKYKVGDVAALFPKPKEPTTEAGKKLQSLFKEFHAVKNISRGSSHQNAGSQTATLKSESTETENERLPKKNKKRKFADTENSQSFVEEQKVKKFKQDIPEYAKNSMPSKKKNIFSTEQGFPRRKKFSNSNKNKFIKNFDEFKREEPEHDDFYSQSSFSKKNSKKVKKAKGLDDVKDSVLSSEVNEFLSEQGFSKNKKFKFGEDNHGIEEDKNLHFNAKQESNKNFKSKNKKQKAIFIKKSKKTEQVISKHNIESNSNKLFLKGNSAFQNEVKNFNTKRPKDLNESNEHEGKRSSQSPNASLNHISENKDSEKHEVNVVESSRNDNSSSKDVQDFVRNKNFKKNVNNSNNNSVKKSEQVVYGKELDFIKIPGIKPEVSGGELSRTLFVGNLPLDTKKKALKNLFSPFGEIENIRFHGNETDKAKIFSENGCKSKFNGKNYAADSIPGYIVFKNKESAIFALALSGSLFKGHHITVDFALPAGSHKLYDDKRSIFIGNLPFDCKDDNIWEVFSECGRIESVRIVRDKETGIGKGFGFVQFGTVQSKENALNLKDLEIQGRPIRIKEISDNKAAPNNKTKEAPVVKRSNTFKSHAIRLKKKNKDSASRKSVTKIMKKQKKLHEKKKISSILQKSMKK